MVKKRKKKVPIRKIKIIPAPKPKKAVRIPVSLASAQDIIKSVERKERIKREKRERIEKQIGEVKKFGGAVARRIGAQRVVSRRVLRKTKPITVVVRQQEPQSILGQRNRFFKDQFKEEKRNLFFT